MNKTTIILIVVIAFGVGFTMIYWNTLGIRTFLNPYIGPMWTQIQTGVSGAIQQIKDLYTKNPMSVIAGGLTAFTAVFGVARYAYSKLKSSAEATIGSLSTQLRDSSQINSQLQKTASGFQDQLTTKEGEISLLQSNITDLLKKVEGAEALAQQYKIDRDRLQSVIGTIEKIEVVTKVP